MENGCADVIACTAKVNYGQGKLDSCNLRMNTWFLCHGKVGNSSIVAKPLPCMYADMAVKKARFLANEIRRFDSSGVVYNEITGNTLSIETDLVNLDGGKFEQSKPMTFIS